MTTKKQRTGNDWLKGQRYARVPVDVLSKLTGGELRVYVALAAFAGSDNTVWASQAKLAKDLDISARAVRKTLKRLRHLGVIEEITRGTNSKENRCSTYRVHTWGGKRPGVTEDSGYPSSVYTEEPRVPTTEEPRVPITEEPQVPPNIPITTPNNIPNTLKSNELEHGKGNELKPLRVALNCTECGSFGNHTHAPFCSRSEAGRRLPVSLEAIKGISS